MQKSSGVQPLPFSKIGTILIVSSNRSGLSAIVVDAGFCHAALQLLPDPEPQELSAMGLSPEPVLLVTAPYSREGITFELFRFFDGRQHWIRIEVAELGIEARIRLTSRRGAGDRFPRFVLRRSALKAIPFLDDYLKRTRLFDSLSPTNKDATVLLARFVHALAFPQVDIYWDKHSEPDQIQIDHHNHCSMDDRPANLIRRTPDEHRDAEIRRLEILKGKLETGAIWRYGR